ncbi:iron-containing alcohol dehydrogenase [Proteus myxofaciens]|uniref:Putative oxidoreductase n=1 Tax=Proteus myxofaciens ATCC 19692 TaxID=1354337 RepID=A0A198FM83_9GAMM|nr:iron-containing alcohol dehydrogenase [Proteus myxofaciens]OAT25880.1 putative oxidoreductase [Proteus myxofaciens ATCC 19692]
MQNFTYYSPTRIHFGEGQIKKLRSDITKNEKVLLTYGGGSIKRNGVLDQVYAALSGYQIHEFGGIEPNPSYETLMKAVSYARYHGITYLLAVGGGSVVDGTKFIAAAVPYQGETWDIITQHGNNIEKALPLSCVMTLPATGSETNSVAVISRKQTQDKQAFASPHVYPRSAILDPTTTYSLPPRQTANGVVDAFIHILEQYLTYPVNALVQDEYAEGLLRILIKEGPKALATPEDYDTRANIMWVATQALSGILGVGVPQDWATHALGHELTALHGLDHAQTLAIVLPALLHEKKQTKYDKLIQYAQKVWGINQGSDAFKIDTAINETRNFFEQMGLRTRLSDFKISEADIPALVQKLKEHGQTALGERQDITLEISERIYTAAI